MKIYLNNNCKTKSYNDCLSLLLKTGISELNRDYVTNLLTELDKKDYYDVILEGIILYYLVNDCKVTEDFVFNFKAIYGDTVYKIFKRLNDVSQKKLSKSEIEKIKDYLTYLEEYNDVLEFAKLRLEGVTCKITGNSKYNHTESVGKVLYDVGFLKRDIIISAILRDVLKYSSYVQDPNKTIKQEVEEKFGKDPISTFNKTAECLEIPEWESRRAAQIKNLRNPSGSSFSAIMVIMGTQLLNLNDIKKTIEKSLSPDFFWQNYANISAEKAESYYSDLFKILNRYHCKGRTDSLLYKYEKIFNEIFGNYPD